MANDKMAKFTFEIDVYSDTICPWCYISKKALDKAIATYTAEHPGVDFKLTWKPYMLWPNARVSAYDTGTALRAFYGPNAPAMLERLTRLGAQYGIDFRWDRRTGNSRDAHKLVLLAMERDEAASCSPSPAAVFVYDTPPPEEEEEKEEPPILATATPSSPPGPGVGGLAYLQTYQDRTITHLFTSAFEKHPQQPTNHPQHTSQTPPLRQQQQQQPHSDPAEQGDLSSRAFLARAAVSLGLLPSEAEAHAYLARAGPGRLVDESSARARLAVGVGAVPSYVVQGRWKVGGCQGEEVWLGLFDRIMAASGELSEGGRRGEVRGEEGGGGGMVFC